MYDGVDALQALFHSGLVGEIAAGEPYPVRKDGTRLPGGEVIEHHDVVSGVCRQLRYEIAPYEARPARDKYSHPGTSRIRDLSGCRVAIRITTSRHKEFSNGRNCWRTSWRCP